MEKAKLILIIGLICLIPLLAGCGIKPVSKNEIIQPALGATTTGYSKEDKESWRMKSEQISEQLDKIRKNTLTSCRTAQDFFFQVEENLELLQSNEAKWEKILAQGNALKDICDADYLKYGGK